MLQDSPQGWNLGASLFSLAGFLAPCLVGLGYVCWGPVFNKRHMAIGTEQFSLVCCSIHIFYGEEEASLLSLTGCWCSIRQSKFVLGLKNISHWDHGLSFHPMWSILSFFNLICWRNCIIFEIGQLKQIFRTFVQKRKIISFFRGEVFVLLSKFQSSCTLLGCEQSWFLLPMISAVSNLHFSKTSRWCIFPQHGLCLLIVVRGAWSSFPFSIWLSSKFFELPH